MRTTAAPVCMGVCIIFDNVLAGRSFLTEKPRLPLGHSVRTDRQQVHYPIRNGTQAVTAVMINAHATLAISGQSVTASDFGSNGPRFESGRGRCVESLDKALYSHCPKEKPSH